MLIEKCVVQKAMWKFVDESARKVVKIHRPAVAVMMIAPVRAAVNMENITGNEVIDTENHYRGPIRRRETTIPARPRNKKATSLKVSSFMVSMPTMPALPTMFFIVSWTGHQLLRTFGMAEQREI